MGNCCDDSTVAGQHYYSSLPANQQLVPASQQTALPQQALPSQAFPPLGGVPPQVQPLVVGQVLAPKPSAALVIPSVAVAATVPGGIPANIPSVPPQAAAPALSAKQIAPTTQTTTSIPSGRDLIRESLNDSIYFGLKNPSLLTSSHPSGIAALGTSSFHFGQQRF